MSKTREQLLAALSTVNRALVESEDAVEFRETMELSGSAAADAIKEATDGTLGMCPLGRSGGPPNGNGRIYPEAQFAVAAERCQKSVKEGLFRGAVDHPGYSDGMKSSPILWRKIEFDGSSGMLRGVPHIVSDHSMGKDLMALLNAGSGLAFSTRGRGSAHLPTEEEKKKYGLRDGDDDHVVIIDDYELIAVDVVDNPSCKEATVPGSPPPASQSGNKRDSNESDPLENLIMKTIAEVQSQAPALWNEIQAAQKVAVDAAVLAATKPLTEKVATLEPKAAAFDSFLSHFNPFLEGLKAHSFVKIPERQVSAAEDVKKLETANSQIAELTNKLAAAEGKVATLEKQANDEKTAKELAEKNKVRVEKATAKFEACLKGKKFADEIRAVAKEDKVIDRADFDEAAAEAFVKVTSERFERIAGKLAGPGRWLGLGGNQEHETDKGDKNEAGEVDPIAAEIMSA